MVNPVTVNAGIIVPLTGADVDTWGTLDVNPNMVAIDGLFAGVQTINVVGGPVTLTAPAGFVATPSPGPNQSQNAVLRFTGVLASQALITLPLPGRYVVENLTTGNFQLQLQGVVVTEAVCLPQGGCTQVYNDGARVRFINDAGTSYPGKMEFWAGLLSMASWVINCTKQPYLLCDGSIHNFSDFPYLGARMGSVFGGNGVTTFGTPDLRGRVPLAYDGTGTRITVAGCGLNGQVLGASIDTQSIPLGLTQIPGGITSVGTANGITVNSTVATVVQTTAGNLFGGVQLGSGGGIDFNNAPTISGIQSTGSGAASVTVNNTGAAGNGTGIAAAHPNVGPSQVVGIWVIKT